MKSKILLQFLLASLLLLPLASRAQFDPTHVYQMVLRQSSINVPLEAPGGDHNADEAIVVVRDTDHLSYRGPSLSWQQWIFRSAGNGQVYIINRHSGKYLTAPAYVSQKPYQSGNVNQLWTPVLQSSGDYRFLSAASTGQYLYGADNYGGVSADQAGNFFFAIQGPDPAPYGHGGADFTVTDVSLNLAGGVFPLLTYNNNKVLAQDTDNNQVGQKDGLGTADQQWSFTPYNGYVLIVSRATQKVLTVNGTNNNSYVTAEANTGAYNQQWGLLDINDSHLLTVAEATDGRKFKIHSNYSGKTLGIQDGSQDDGRLATVYVDYGYPWQQWHVPQYTATANRGGGASAAVPAAASAVFTLYPNPVRDVLTVSLPAAAVPTTVRVYDVNGRSAAVRYDGTGKVNVADLAPGLYVLSASDGQHEYHQRFVKE